ncbi:MAG: glutathione peroxidase [Bacteroidetes bacterium]|nr:glutathione peroxidase [Bacteroidota bacterium]
MIDNTKIQGKALYDQNISIKSLDGNVIDLNDFKGKKILFVNVASKCGFTPQYEDLQKLHEKYQDKLVIIGCPCNQFGKQEPGTAKEIKEFCSVNYGITFLLTEKLDVKGENQHPLYSWLCNENKNGLSDFEVKWNFNKFLVNENGVLIHYFGSSTKPFDKELVDAIEK